jgi:thioredoxin reductase (NADPH)
LELDISFGSRAPTEVYDTVIIGGGPAGLSAALYAARATLKTLVVDMHPRAGALGLTERIVNYPGVPEAISGSELLDRFRQQARSFGAEIIQSQVLTTDLRSDPKQVITLDGVFRTRTVIIASGATGRKPSIAGEAELIGKGVSYCATCDAAFFEGKDVAVVGHSEMMVDELATVAKFARKVYLIPHGKLSAEDRAIITQHPKVTFLEGARIVGIEGDRFVTGVALQVDGAKETRPVSGVFVYLTGNQPVLDYLDGSVQTTAEGCLEVDPEDSSTGLPGVFAAGDVACHQVRQVVVAAAQGTLAALAVDKYLREASLGDATRV